MTEDSIFGMIDVVVVLFKQSRRRFREKKSAASTWNFSWVEKKRKLKSLRHGLVRKFAIQKRLWRQTSFPHAVQPITTPPTSNLNAFELISSAFLRMTKMLDSIVLNRFETLVMTWMFELRIFISLVDKRNSWSWVKLANIFTGSASMLLDDKSKCSSWGNAAISFNQQKSICLSLLSFNY